MPLGPFGEVVGTTGTLEALGPDAQNYKTKVIAPRNPKLVRQDEPDHHKVNLTKSYKYSQANMLLFPHLPSQSPVFFLKISKL